MQITAPSSCNYWRDVLIRFWRFGEVDCCALIVFAPIETALVSDSASLDKALHDTACVTLSSVEDTLSPVLSITQS
jgi:uncharacterized RDD family membrane protein YckC